MEVYEREMLSQIDDEREERGILSAADRNYLRNPEEYSRQAANARQRRIVERVRNGLLDFQYLADPEFPEEYLEQAFASTQDGPVRGPVVSITAAEDAEKIAKSDPEVKNGATEAITTFHRIYPPATFNNMVEEAVQTAVARYYSGIEVVDASYNPDIRERDSVHDRAKKKLDNDDPLTPRETKLLLEYGEVDPDRVVEHVREDGED